MRILIADDEYISRRVMQELVREWGEVEPVASGDEALQAALLAMDDGRAFHLILLDIEMPGLDGHEVLRRLRAEEVTRGNTGRRSATVIMTTVRDSHESVFASFRDQCEAYLIKPVTREVLYGHLKRLGLVKV